MEKVIELVLWIVYFFSLFFVTFWLTTALTERKVTFRKKWKNWPAVSIIVPAYNEELGIKETLHSLAKLDYPRHLLEIIIVNDGSSDQTEQRVHEVIAQFPETAMTLLSQENKGKGAALNRGIAVAHGEYVVCLDADSIVPDAQALYKMLPHFSSPDIAAVLPCMKVGQTRNLLQKMQHYEYLVNMFYKELMGRLDCIKVTPGPFAIYRKEIIVNLGGFDEVFNRHLTEDLEIALRLQKHNYKIVQTMDTVVLTNPPATLKHFYRQRKRWYTGGFLNTLRYKKLMFNRKFGDFGIWEMPVTLLSGFIMVTLLFSVLYYLTRPLLEWWANLRSIDFDLWTILQKFSFDLSVLDFHYSLIFVGVTMAAASIFVLARSHVLTREKAFRYGAMPLVFYSLLYFLLLAIGWVIIFYDLARNKEQRW